MGKFWIFIALIFILTSCTRPLHEFEESKELMGTIITITIYDKDEIVAKLSLEKAFDEFKRIDGLLSSYKNDSELSILNREKIIKNPSSDLVMNLKKSIYYGEISNGAFDPTVKVVLELYQNSFAEDNQPPTDQEISDTIKSVTYLGIDVNNEEIKIGNTQKITLGGIAKGYAVDRVAKILINNGIRSALINAGGDILTIGKKYDSVSWTIALADPRDENNIIALIKSEDSAIVTSGDYTRYFDENLSFHHIINPKTGYSAQELISVTIIANNTFDADAISTSVFVLGPEEGLDFIESIDNAEGLLITSERDIIRSSGFIY